MTVELEIDDHVADITIRRESMANAIDRCLANDLYGGLNRLAFFPGAHASVDPTMTRDAKELAG